MNPGAMQFFDLLETEPSPHLEITVNSNLGVTFDRVDRLLVRVNSLLKQNKIRKFSFYTSIDSWGEQAEYMRTGMNIVHWERNMRAVLATGTSMNFMCTFNVLCVTNFQSLLEKVIEWRKEFGKEVILFDTPYLKEPPHWMINILTDDFIPYMDRTLDFIKANPEWLSDLEYEKFKRVADYMKAKTIPEEKIRAGRRDFYSFFTENDKRLGTDLLATFPEYTEFYNLCKDVYENYDN
jgi:hypothetical protein